VRWGQVQAVVDNIYWFYVFIDWNAFKLEEFSNFNMCRGFKIKIPTSKISEVLQDTVVFTGQSTFCLRPNYVIKQHKLMLCFLQCDKRRNSTMFEWKME
jgi:hypothetical protein